MIPIEIQKKIKDLREELNQANHEYYIKENSSLTDFEYDKKFKELLTLENEYPDSIVEESPTLFIDNNGISDSWKFSRIKKKINFKNREKQLLKLFDKHRGKHGSFCTLIRTFDKIGSVFFLSIILWAIASDLSNTSRFI